ncbi:MAG: polysulfide reductase NrfD [Deltaproteobacteria bacterium]|nr:polysulfide reductase NrfD [Deltaproteobacteria bacterium]
MKPMIQFAIDFATYVAKGSAKFYVWVLCLSFFVLMMFYASFRQMTEGMIVTNLNDQVSWGLYMENLVFLVGVAAGAVTVLFPAYAYNHKKMKEVVVLGEMLAVAAVFMCTLFVIHHMGQPFRVWHIIPVIGILNWPNSMLAWDIIVLNGYLALNAIGAFYYLYKKYKGVGVNRFFYMPLVYVSMFWAISIHTVTALLLSTMPARPMWFHSIMPFKFIATAFAAGPAIIILIFLVIRNHTEMKISDEVFKLLSQFVTWFVGIALFLMLSEVVTELYPSTEHSNSLQYLMLGKHGLSGLVAWYWASVCLMIGGFIILLIPALRRNQAFFLPVACIMVFLGVYIEKGMGLILPGFIPSPIGEYAEYTPSVIEMLNSTGSWALGLLLYTVLAKGSIGVLLGKVKYNR